MTPRGMPAPVRRLYDERDELVAIVEDPWATQAARARAAREIHAIDAALSNREA